MNISIMLELRKESTGSDRTPLYKAKATTPIVPLFWFVCSYAFLKQTQMLNLLVYKLCTIHDLTKGG